MMISAETLINPSVGDVMKPEIKLNKKKTASSKHAKQLKTTVFKFYTKFIEQLAEKKLFLEEKGGEKALNILQTMFEVKPKAPRKIDPEKRCKHIKENKEQCGSPKKKGIDYCISHFEAHEVPEAKNGDAKAAAPKAKKGKKKAAEVVAPPPAAVEDTDSDSDSEEEEDAITAQLRRAEEMKKKKKKAAKAKKAEK